jgi:hypothetical protein
MRASLISVSPGYNLGLAKLADYLTAQGWQVARASQVYPLTDDVDLYALSVVWSWDVPRLIELTRRVPRGRATWIGGPGITALAEYIARETGIRPVVGPDARFEHQPGHYAQTRTTRGCPVNCAFCIASKMDGREIREYRDFNLAPVIIDDNILRASWEHQEHVVARLAAQYTARACVDFNSGFDPAVFTRAHYDLYSRLPLKTWRLAFDDEREADDVERMIRLLRTRGVPQNKIAVYVLIGFNDTPPHSLARARRVIEWGGEPRVQAYRPLTWLDARTPFVNARLGWDAETVTAMPRYFYGYHWRRMTFDEFRAYTRARPFERGAMGSRPTKT